MMILALFHVFMLVTICHAHFGPILPNDIFSPKDYQGFVTRENLVFTIQAVYTGANKPSSISVLGNGLGLSWESPVTMDSVDECADQAASKLETDEDFQFRFVHVSENSVDTEMLGVTQRIPLPQSKVSVSFQENPVYTSYPFFFTYQGSYETVSVTSSDEYLSSRNIVLYTPPGFTENPRPVYDVLYMTDLSPDPALVSVVANALDESFVKGETAEAVVLGFGDWLQDDGRDRTNLLTMVPGELLFCKEGSPQDNCGGCVPGGPAAWITMTEDEYFEWMDEKGCGQAETVGGIADATLDFLTQEVFSEANSILVSRGSSLTSDPERTLIVGYSLGGLMACYAAWTRPNVFGRAACQSSSFWWPSFGSNDYFGEFYFMNETLKANLLDRPPQMVLIDVGGEEEGDTGRYQMERAASQVFDYMSAHHMFTPDHNLWLHNYPTHSHSYGSFIKRLWSPLQTLSAGIRRTPMATVEGSVISSKAAEDQDSRHCRS